MNILVLTVWFAPREIWKYSHAPKHSLIPNFCGILSGHVSIGWIPDTFLFKVHSRRATRMDFTSGGMTWYHGRGRNYRCHECTRARQLLPGALRPVTATATASFSISRPRNSKAAVIIRKAACRSQVGTRGARHANPGAVPMQVSVATSSVISFAIKRLWSLPRR